MKPLNITVKRLDPALNPRAIASNPLGAASNPLDPASSPLNAASRPRAAALNPLELAFTPRSAPRSPPARPATLPAMAPTPPLPPGADAAGAAAGAEAALPGWVITFAPFTWMHIVTLVWVLSAIGVSIALGRRWRSGTPAAAPRPELEARLAAAWGGFVIAINLWSILYWNLPKSLGGMFDRAESLPLQLCDLACLLAPLVFLAPRLRWPRALLFFWGLGLSTQALVTPTVLEGPGHMKYWLFWLVHLAIIGSGAYDLVVRGFRPGVRDLMLAAAATVLYALAMVPINRAWDANYGFIGNRLRATPTLVDRLGPWPERIAVMAAIVMGLFILMFAAARLVARLENRAAARRAAGAGENR